ncbi:hypothetical protein PLICRDRAFT_468309 [Plicaturopsis crispa FD-325 SS-3]|nr:hypothetical protein PLICRDRAFT_468309 [Plicaturopsis crispa FD-325 SS-3]
MPRTNTTIDNVSPLISYQPTAAWRPGTKATDPLFLQYSNGGTFYLTQIYGASASFSFNGTGVWIFGAKRPNHGPYNITLTSGDGASSTGSSASSSGNGAASTGSGASSSGAGTSSSGDVASSSSDVASFTGDGASAQPIFQTPLFIAKDLPQGKHEVVISNAFTDAGNDFLDIDFITWESEIGGDGEGLTQTLVQDTDPAWVYEPVAAWSTSLDNLAGYSSGTGHGSSTDGSTATLTFSGDGVHIFGTVGPQNSNYTVQLDSASPPTAYNASSQTFAAQTLLWGAAGLGPGEHNVTLTSRPVKAGLGLNIDYAVLLTTGSIRCVLPLPPFPSLPLPFPVFHG